MALTQISTDGIKNGTITGSDLATNVDLVDNQKIRFGAGNDLQIYHDGSHNYIEDTGTGNLFLKSDSVISIRGTIIALKNAANTETLLKCVQDGAVELYYDNSKKLETTSSGVSFANGADATTSKLLLALGNASNKEATIQGISSSTNEKGIEFKTYSFAAKTPLTLTHDGHLKVPDNSKLKIGTGDDLQIYHNGTNSFIENSTGILYIRDTSGGDVRIQGKSGEESIICNDDSSVDLYFDNSIRFNTNAAGVRFYGSLRGIDNEKLELGSSQDLRIFHDGSKSIIDDNFGELQIRSEHIIIEKSDGSETYIDCQADGAVELYHNNVKTFQTTSFGAETIFSSVSGDTSIFKVLHGNLSQGVGIGYHSIHAIGGNTDVVLNLMSKGSSDLSIQTSAGENMAVFTPNGAAKLYHNNTHTFSTTDYGASVSFNSPGGTTPIFKVQHANQSQGVALGYAGVVSTGSNANVTLNIRSKGTSNVDISTSTDESMAKFIPNGAVELYHNNEKVLETAGSKVNFKQRIQIHNDGPGSGHGMALGQWDGSNHRIEGDANRPMLITSYNSGGIKMGISGANKVAINTHGIVFNGDTAEANALDDYEEGTYTPFVQTTNGVSAGTSSTPQGTYIKIGRLVYTTLSIAVNSFSGVNTSGFIRVYLPFTAENDGIGTEGNMYVSQWSIGSSSISWMGGEVQNGFNFVYVHYHNGNNNNTNVMTGANANGEFNIRATVMFRVP